MKSKNVVVITGASSGIGKDLADVFASHGHHILLVARRTELLNEISKSLESKYNVKVYILSLDLQIQESIKQLFQYCDANELLITHFVNNAGLGYYKPFIKHSEDEIQSTLTLNINALTLISHLVSNYWISKKVKGALLNVASVAAYVPLDNYVVYAASKSYVKNFSLALRNEVEKHGIQVSCLCPGGTKTEFFQTSKQTISTLGEKMMMPSHTCAVLAFKGFMNNSPIIVTGFSNKVSVWLSRIFPEYFVVKYSTKIFNFFMDKD